MLFRQQAVKFIQESQTRRRNPVREQSARIYQSYLDAHILPFLGEYRTEFIENGVMKNFIEHLSTKKLSASTICRIFNVVTAVVASEVDPNGNEINPRKWNHDFIDLPVVNKSDANTEIITPEQIEAALQDSTSQLQALLVLLTASGMRIGEALALQGHKTRTPDRPYLGLDDRTHAFPGSSIKYLPNESYWDSEKAVVVVKSTLVRGKISAQPKTDAGNREIDLHPDINDYLKTAGLPDTGFLFQNSLGDAARVNTLYDQIDGLGLGTGFHAFRRFRATHLEASGMPRALTSYYLGHSGTSITDRYIKIGQDLTVRKEWALKAGYGFNLKEAK